MGCSQKKRLGRISAWETPCTNCEGSGQSSPSPNSDQTACVFVMRRCFHDAKGQAHPPCSNPNPPCTSPRSGVCQLKRTHTQHPSEEIHSFKLMYCTRKLQGLNNIERKRSQVSMLRLATLTSTHSSSSMGGWVSALQSLLDCRCSG